MKPGLATFGCERSDALIDIIRTIELAAHAGLDKIHEMLVVIEDLTAIQRRSDPGINPQAACISEILLAEVSDIEMDVVGDVNYFSRLGEGHPEWIIKRSTSPAPPIR